MTARADQNRFRMKRRNAQMKFLLENFKKPVLLSDEKGDIKYDENGYSPTGISLAILNCNIENNCKGDVISTNQISTFMSHIQGYLPKDLRPSDYRCKPLFTYNTFSSNCDIGEDTMELLESMREWYYSMKYQIMNDITFKYYMSGKIQFNELLKRRFKNEYSEKVEQTVQAAVKADNSINIIVEPYTEEDN